MKALRIILIAAIILVALFLVAGLFAPNKQSISQSTVIKAPAFAIFQHIKYMDKMAKWHPMLKKDPNVLLSTQGQDGEPGAIRFWKSKDDQVGEGFDEIVELEENNKLKTIVKTVEPKSSTSTSIFTLNPLKEGVKVSWDFEYEIPYPFNAFLLFGDGQETQNKYFAEGLLGLKNILEKYERTTVNYSLSSEEFSGGLYLSKKFKSPYKDAQVFINKTIAELSNFREKAGLRKFGSPIAAIQEWREDGIVEVRVGVPISDRKDFPDELILELPVKQECRTVYVNDLFSNRERAHRNIQKQLRDQNLSFEYPILEIFKKMPSEDDGKSSVKLVYCM